MPGIDTYSGVEEQVYHRYYQWVSFVLFFQAIAFYFSRYFWKRREGGLMSDLIGNLHFPNHPIKSRTNEIAQLVTYFKLNLGHHNPYFRFFVSCELFNFANVILQMHLIDVFLDGAFYTYGLDVIGLNQVADPAQRVDPMTAVFPRMTKCTFHRFGTSGEVQKFDALCMLSMNIINAKIYLILWFWLVTLGLASGLALCYRTLILLFPSFRGWMLRSNAPRCNPAHLRKVLAASKIGDWFVLYSLSESMNQVNYQVFIKRFAEYLVQRTRKAGRTTDELELLFGVGPPRREEDSEGSDESSESEAEAKNK